MQYKAKTKPLTQLMVTGSGFHEPLCNSCKTRDCENPIEKRTVVVVGIPKKWKVWIHGQRVGAVTDCNGYCIKRPK